MLRNSFIAFIGGWSIWFWIDKPRTGLEQFLRADDSTLINFQHSFDLLKAGYLAQSYIFIWNAHYIILSLILGVILSLIYSSISTYLIRKRTRHFLFPASLRKQKKEDEGSNNVNNH